MDVVKLDSGYISGTVLGDPDKPVHIYRGIPYAAPPVGDLRWRPPQPMAPWAGIRECTRFSAIAPQFVMEPGEHTETEDCLYLNVSSPVRENLGPAAGHGVDARRRFHRWHGQRRHVQCTCIASQRGRPCYCQHPVGATWLSCSPASFP